MKFNHLFILITLLLTIEIYKVVCKPFGGSQLQKRVETTKQTKSNKKTVQNKTSPVNAKNVQSNNTQSKTKIQAKAQTNQKKASSKQNNTNKTVAQGNSRITTVTSNAKSNTSNASTTTDPVLDASVSNRCAQYCSTIHDKCQYFNSISLSEYTLENIYPPQNNSFGQCLCKENNIDLYLECSLCLLSTAGSPDLNSADQIIHSKCQAIEQTQTSNNPITNDLESQINNNMSDMKNSTDVKNVNSMTPISFASEEKKKNKSFNPRNLIIICSIVGGVLAVYGGYKLNEHIKDERRKTLPPSY